MCLLSRPVRACASGRESCLSSQPVPLNPGSGYQDNRGIVRRFGYRTVARRALLRGEIEQREDADQDHDDSDQRVEFGFFPQKYHRVGDLHSSRHSAQCCEYRKGVLGYADASVECQRRGNTEEADHQDVW